MNAKNELIMIKDGTTSMVDSDDQLSFNKLHAIAEQLVDLRGEYDVAMTTSAAISAGAAALGVDRADFAGDLDGLSVLAAVGQPIKFAMWQHVFGQWGLQMAQHLATPRELQLSNRESYAFHRKLARSILMGMIVDINENDAIADDEIKVGDNDVLGGLAVSGLAREGIWDQIHYIKLTDVDGYFDGDPRAGVSRVIRVVDDIDAVAHHAGKSQSKHGTGGGDTTIAAARIVTAARQHMYVANSAEPDVIRRVLKGEIGTHFRPAHVQ